MDDKEKDKNTGEDNDQSEESTEENNTQKSTEDVKNSGENQENLGEEAEKLLKKERIPLLDEDGKPMGGIDKKRFDELNDQSKLYKMFAPVIEKYKDKPEELQKLLSGDNAEVSKRLENIEKNLASEKRGKLKEAVQYGLSNFKHFKETYPQIENDVHNLVKQHGLSEMEAVRRTYLYLHPEETNADRQRRAQEAQNDMGSFRSGGGRAPNTSHEQEGDNSELSEAENKVADQLMKRMNDRGYGNLFKTKADFEKALKRHEKFLQEKNL